MLHDFSILLSEPEQELFRNPSQWRWITAEGWDPVEPMDHPEHLEWGRKEGGGHALPQRELCFCLSGETVSTLGDQVFLMTPGTVMLFNINDWHDRIASPYAGSTRCLWLHVPNRHIVAANLYQMNKDGSCYNEELKFTSSHLGELITDIWDRCEQEPFSDLHWQFLKSTITFLLFEAAGSCNLTGELDSKEQVVDEVCRYIDEHLNQKLNLKHLSEVAGYHPHFLHRLFRRYRQVSPHTYVINARLKRAKEMLSEGFTVEMICEEIGVYPPSYFSYFFQKHTQFSPSRWREIHGVAALRDSGGTPRRRKAPQQRVPPRSRMGGR